MTTNRKFREILTGTSKEGRSIRLVYRQYNGSEYGFTVAAGNCILFNGEENECRVFFARISEEAA